MGCAGLCRKATGSPQGRAPSNSVKTPQNLRQSGGVVGECSRRGYLGNAVGECGRAVWGFVHTL